MSEKMLITLFDAHKMTLKFLFTPSNQHLKDQSFPAKYDQEYLDI